MENNAFDSTNMATAVLYVFVYSAPRYLVALRRKYNIRMIMATVIPTVNPAAKPQCAILYGPMLCSQRIPAGHAELISENMLITVIAAY